MSWPFPGWRGRGQHESNGRGGCLQFNPAAVTVAATAIADQRYTGGADELAVNVPQTMAQADASAEATVAVKDDAPPPPREEATVPPPSSVPTGDQTDPGAMIRDDGCVQFCSPSYVWCSQNAGALLLVLISGAD